ncbi:MAG: AAA family ATPase [Dehalococcoidia bacterium]
MITRVRISNFRLFGDFEIEPRAGLNILVGDNEAGKSTILQALTLVLTGRSNGRSAADELTPDWFHRPAVLQFFDDYAEADPKPLPTIEIEVYLVDADDKLQKHRGVHNTRGEDCPGLRLTIEPSADYAAEIREYLDAEDCPRAVPVEYYEVHWRNFADEPLSRRPAGLGHVLIDSRTIRSQRGVDYHTRQLLHDFIEPDERAAISVAHRRARHEISTTYLDKANERIAKHDELVEGRAVEIDFDQGGASSWHGSIIPRIDEVPFALAGQGVQAAMKIALAMSRSAEQTSFVLIEEPENHLSHTRLMRLVASIEALAGERQSFLTTHSSFVLNRLGIDRLLLLGPAGIVTKLTDLPADTVRYFQKLSGFDTLRLVLAERLVLVEGPSDEIVFERFFRDRYDRGPHEAGVDVVSLRGVALRRSLELCAALDRHVIALRDNDGKVPDHWIEPLRALLSDGKRQIEIGDPSDGATLEPQLVRANGEGPLRSALSLDASDDVTEWMSENKTESALRILESPETLSPPPYIQRALDLLR